MKLIKFKQDNCTPCKMLDGFLNEMGVEVDQVVNLSNPESDDDLILAGKYAIEKTPTLILINDNGSEIQRFKGVGQNGVKSILARRGLI
ncbi:thioredoxin family protein [Bacillus atrophaeus]|uniref:thioredoxin family protein n=1 Tax=Bacillus atrophaeus TaxID=1452 RepID=UPI002282B58E|nr:thioredoxin family protein [Bacillus atrophaeus]MCY7948042.1 thioredoxin family protein [Bacillus atrophaeus]MCY8098013.1 thioredoxin family protein [Bacillus atrophaeus]MCY9169937.1 thioredoxin family protein [Bacillus atrophaeus]MEC0740662.1 thioredoxin family protein [Bacillus atrophaeus]MEC0747074.1 thioredoxin family protein [Bacillus atrophaeus]